MASIQALSAATQDRKARLAQLKSLKRKQPDSVDTTTSTTAEPPLLSSDSNADAGPDSSAALPSYLSGRNYDPTTGTARLGFDHAPSAGTSGTLEQQAAAVAAATRAEAEAAERADNPLDLFALQPKKPNWDLKRDLERKLEVLGVRTDNAIARLVRARIAAGQEKAAAVRAGQEGIEGEALGMEGTTLVEATHVREREDEEEARRERLEEEALLDGS